MQSRESSTLPLNYKMNTGIIRQIFLQKWQKDSDTIELPIQETIAYNEIDWGVIPKVIKETEKRVAKLDHYYPGVSIVILNGSQGKWTWTVGVDDIRGHTALNLVYDLSGNYLSQWD